MILTLIWFILSDRYKGNVEISWQSPGVCLAEPSFDPFISLFQEYCIYKSLSVQIHREKYHDHHDYWSGYPLALYVFALQQQRLLYPRFFANYLSHDHQSLCCKVVHFFMFHLRLALETETVITMIMVSIGTLYMFAQQQQRQPNPTWIAKLFIPRSSISLLQNCSYYYWHSSETSSWYGNWHKYDHDIHWHSLPVCPAAAAAPASPNLNCICFSFSTLKPTTHFAEAIPDIWH